MVSIARSNRAPANHHSRHGCQRNGHQIALDIRCARLGRIGADAISACRRNLGPPSPLAPGRPSQVSKDPPPERATVTMRVVRLAKGRRLSRCTKIALTALNRLRTPVYISGPENQGLHRKTNLKSNLVCIPSAIYVCSMQTLIC
jgi:hypothetical protein